MTANETLEQIIVDEGICVTEKNNIPKCLDGLYCEYGNEKIICLRSGMPSNKRLCVLAEEYAHMVTSWGDAQEMDTSSMGKQEARAIAYAIELVVPIERLYEAREAGVCNAYECAECLGVTGEFLTWVFAYYEAKIPGFREFFIKSER